MTTKSKPKPEPEIPKVCVAIRRLRKTLNLTQEAFAAQLGTGVMSLSRWERGRFQPRDGEVLVSLCGLAAEARLDEELEVFQAALMAIPSGPHRLEKIMVPTYGPREWELMMASRIAASFLPAVERAARVALAPALELLHEVIADMAKGRNVVPTGFYGEVERQLNELVARKIFGVGRQEEKQ